MKLLRTRVVKHFYETWELPYGLTLKVHRFGKKVEQELLHGKTTYHYLKPEVFDLIQEKPFHEIQWHDFIIKDILAEGKLDKKRVVKVDFCNHALFRLGKQALLSTIHRFDYCTSFSNNGWSYDELEEYLKNHPYVKQITTKEIEYYNSDFHGHKGVEILDVLLPQKVTDRIWSKLKGKERCPYYLDEEIVRPWSKTDPLKIKKFKRDEK